MADMQVQMDNIVKPTFDKRRKGYKFKKDSMEIFIKGEDKDAAIAQMQTLLEKEKKKPETHTFAEGGYEDGGLKDEGGTVDPVSGNEVPSGSTKSEVRDDIPAQLSEGEFVFPADVVRYIGLENLMELRQKAKQGLQQMEDMGQMGNADEAIMEDDGEYESEIDELIENFDPNSPETLEFKDGGLTSFNPLQSSQVTPMQPANQQMPSFKSFIQAPAQQAAQQLQPVAESKQFIGPNGEKVTIQFVNGQPVTPVPEGYREMTQQEIQAEMQPKIEAPEVAPIQAGPEGEGLRDQKKGPKDIGMGLAGKGAYKTDKAYQKAVDDLMAFEGKLFGGAAMGVLSGIAPLAFGAVKRAEPAYQEKINNYYKEVARIAAEKEPDRFTEAGLYSRLTNTDVPVIDIAKEGTSSGFTDSTRNTYVDSDGLVRDTTGLSNEAKDGLAITAASDTSTPVGYDDSEDEASGRTGQSTGNGGGGTSSGGMDQGANEDGTGAE